MTILRILIACCLVAITVAIHSGGLANLEPSMAFTCAATPAFLESDAVHDSNRLVSHIDPRDRDCGLGTGFLVAEMSA